MKNQPYFVFKRYLLFATIIIGLFLLGGCSANSMNPFGRGSGVKGVGLSGASSASPQYLDFGDILIPREFKVNKRKTYIVESAGLITGILSLKGRVEVLSLIDFFKNNMPKDGWQFITSFKTPIKTIMVFRKADRWSIININGEVLYTYLEVAVAKTTAQVANGLMKQ